jgi:hypothetical protein
VVKTYPNGSADLKHTNEDTYRPNGEKDGKDNERYPTAKSG